MKIHKAGPRYSLNGTKAELRALAEALQEQLRAMDDHEANLASSRGANASPLGEHYIDFGLHVVEGVEEVE